MEDFTDIINIENSKMICGIKHYNDFDEYFAHVFPEESKLKFLNNFFLLYSITLSFLFSSNITALLDLNITYIGYSGMMNIKKTKITKITGRKGKPKKNIFCQNKEESEKRNKSDVINRHHYNNITKDIHINNKHVISKMSASQINDFNELSFANKYYLSENFNIPSFISKVKMIFIKNKIDLEALLLNYNNLNTKKNIFSNIQLEIITQMNANALANSVKKNNDNKKFNEVSNIVNKSQIALKSKSLIKRESKRYQIKEFIDLDSEISSKIQYEEIINKKEEIKYEDNDLNLDEILLTTSGNNTPNQVYDIHPSLTENNFMLKKKRKVSIKEKDSEYLNKAAIKSNNRSEKERREAASLPIKPSKSINSKITNPSSASVVKNKKSIREAELLNKEATNFLLYSIKNEDEEVSVENFVDLDKEYEQLYKEKKQIIEKDYDDDKANEADLKYSKTSLNKSNDNLIKFEEYPFLFNNNKEFCNEYSSINKIEIGDVQNSNNNYYESSKNIKELDSILNNKLSKEMSNSHNNTSNNKPNIINTNNNTNNSTNSNIFNNNTILTTNNIITCQINNYVSGNISQVSNSNIPKINVTSQLKYNNSNDLNLVEEENEIGLKIKKKPNTNQFSKNEKVQVQFCFICSRKFPLSLSANDINRHINFCIDGRGNEDDNLFDKQSSGSGIKKKSKRKN